MDDDKKSNKFESINFPIAKRVEANTLAESIDSMTNAEVREAMEQMFKKFEEETGYEINVVGDTSPTRVLIPDKYKNKINKNMKIEIYKGGFLYLQWKWRLISNYGAILAYGSGFNTIQNAKVSLIVIEKLFKEDHPAIVYYSGSIRPNWKWKLVAKNGRIVASDKGFTSEDECEKSLNVVKQYFKSR